MQRVAYTIGRTSAYDQGIREPGGVKKLGRMISSSPPYDGGWIWPTFQQANHFLVNLLEQQVPEWKVKDFSAYELELPNGWDIDASSNPITNEETAHGAHFLLNDAQIIRKITL